MGNKKPKVCKCGHSKDLHIKHKKLKVTGNCQSCACTEFMRRERPDTYDKAFVYVGLGLCGLFIILVSWLIIGMPETSWNKKIEIPITGGWIVIAMIGFLVWLVSNWISGLILPYWQYKNRKSYPESLGES